MTDRQRASFPTAAALLALWARPWSPSATRFAVHQITTAYHAGCDVLEIGIDGRFLLNDKHGRPPTRKGRFL